jgi:hypothetical protein
MESVRRFVTGASALPIRVYKGVQERGLGQISTRYFQQ